MKREEQSNEKQGKPRNTKKSHDMLRQIKKHTERQKHAKKLQENPGKNKKTLTTKKNNETPRKTRKCQGAI